MKNNKRESGNLMSMGLRADDKELQAYTELLNLYKDSPIPDKEILANLGLYMNRSSLSRVLTMANIYQQIVGVHGVVAEFGSRWGQNLALFILLRNIFEPYNFTRKIIGFDTFDGFPDVHKKDGANPGVRKGAYGVIDNYEEHINKVLGAQEQLGPRGHIKKHAVIKGDVSRTLPSYIDNHPETIFSLVYFDMDIYKPTKDSLDIVLKRMPKGGILAFDELCLPEWPGETTAFLESLDIHKTALSREPYFGNVSYVKVN